MSDQNSQDDGPQQFVVRRRRRDEEEPQPGEDRRKKPKRRKRPEVDVTPSHKLPGVSHVPRKQHGTRVSFPIVCTSCGAEETLGYMPRVPMNEILCSKCLIEQEGRDSSWAKNREVIQRENAIRIRTKAKERELDFEIVEQDAERTLEDTHLVTATVRRRHTVRDAEGEAEES